MHLSPLAKAESRLRAAERAYASMLISTDPVEIADFWTDFLIAWKGVYMHVQQAAKASPQEMQWFGKINSARKKDPLLMWLYEARNDDGHGMDVTAIPFNWMTKCVMEKEGTIGSFRQESDGSITYFDIDGSVAGRSSLPSGPTLMLQPVSARGNRTINLPMAHNGSPIDGLDYRAVANAGMIYIRSLLVEALNMHRA